MDTGYATHVRQLSKRNNDSPAGPLESAESHLARSAKASRASDEGRSQFRASFAAFLDWGEENKLIRADCDFEFFGTPPHGAGDEHEVWFHEKTNRWFKATYQNQFGLAWGRNGTATPGEYLTRLVLQNKYFGDDIHLVALVRCGTDLRVLISQPHIAGSAALYQEIRNWFLALKFKPLESNGSSAWYLKSENLLVADAHEGNVLKTPDGVLVPIDLNLIQPEGELFEWASAEPCQSSQSV